MAPAPTEPAELVLLSQHLQDSPVSAEQIRRQTEKDPVLAPVVRFLKQGWPTTMEKNSPIMPFFQRNKELSLYEGCILWGARVIVLSALQEAILAELHEGHPVRIKGLARS